MCSSNMFSDKRFLISFKIGHFLLLASVRRGSAARAVPQTPLPRSTGQHAHLRSDRQVAGRDLFSMFVEVRGCVQRPAQCTKIVDQCSRTYVCGPVFMHSRPRDRVHGTVSTEPCPRNRAYVPVYAEPHSNIKKRQVLQVAL